VAARREKRWWFTVDEPRFPTPELHHGRPAVKALVKIRGRGALDWLLLSRDSILSRYKRWLVD
jgi:hypothetical protein